MKLNKPFFWDSKKLTLSALLLLPISHLIMLLALFKKLITNKKKFKIPVICVGNIYLGGTGKTPVTIEIYKMLKNIGYKPAFIKKKYEAYKDESIILTAVGSLYEEKSRVSAINKAIKDQFNIALLDDGFQDYSVKKDINILCFNEKEWLGNGFTIPAGPLREKFQSINRANFIFIKGKENSLISEHIKKFNKDIMIYFFNYVPKNISDFLDKKVIAFTGIGSSFNFFELLKSNTINLVDELTFPDHYWYNNNEILKMKKKAEEQNAILLTTEKDFVRLGDIQKKEINFLKIETKIENKNDFEINLKKLI